MAYITVSNSKKLIRKLDDVKLDSIEESIYKTQIDFFSKRESANLKGIRELFRDPEKFVLEYYNPIVVFDSYRYVYPETQPSYHKNDTCERLNSPFFNIEIPFEIKEKGMSEIIRFREWYKKSKFDKDNPKEFIFALQKAFSYVGLINPKSIVYKNSGPELKKNYSLEELESEIDDLLLKANDYFHKNLNIRDLLYRYQKMTFLAFIYGPLKNNQSGLKDEDLKSFLRSYEETFKTPVKERLIEYYRIKFNPKMEFKGQLLETLGFHNCHACLPL